MTRRDGTLARWFAFHVERWVQRGVLHQLALMAAIVVAVAVTGGIAAWIATDKFAHPGTAIWWAFLRLTDPGYLGDDEGIALRTISTVVTILGYVVFMGSLIAILTQWLAGTLRRLESGVTPIAMDDHIVILGWTNRTPEIARRLLGARGRLRRFLEHHGTSALHIVILSDDVGAERRADLRVQLGKRWDERRVLLRSGSTIKAADLRRLDIARATTIVVPGAEFELGGTELTDVRVIKTLLTLHDLLEGEPDPPQIVAELFDSNKAALARRALGEGVEVVSSDRLISRLVYQCICHPGLGETVISLFSHREGLSLYLRRFPELAGETLGTLSHRFVRATVLGYVRREGERLVPHLALEDAPPLEAEDDLILLADHYDSAVPDASSSGADPAPADATITMSAGAARRVLILGWSHKIAPLLAECAAGSRPCAITLMSTRPREERIAELRGADRAAAHVTVELVDGDYTSEGDLAALDPASFDTVVLFASDWLGSRHEADARSILGSVLVRSLVAGTADPPEVVLELLDPDNAPLFEDGPGVLVVSPRLIGHVLAHVALRPDLNAVFDALFCAEGAAITTCPVSAVHGIDGATTFAQLQALGVARGVAVLGFASARDGVVLNPDRGRPLGLGREDRLVVVANEPR